MVDYNIVVPQPYDTSSDVANALRFRAAQQAEAENQLKLRAWMEDRAYTLKQRQAAAANAAAEKARKEELLGIYGNFGVTPAVTGARGQSYSGTGVANDPFETTRNKLIQRGFGAQAEDLTKVQNEILTGRKTATETKGLDLKNLNDRLSLLQRFAPMVNSPEDAAAYSRMLANEFPEFAGLSGSPDEAARRSSAAFAQDPDTWRLHSLNLTAEQLVQANAKAAEAKQPKPTEVDVGGEKIFVDTNPQSPTYNQQLAGYSKSRTPAEDLIMLKNEWEQAHPDYEVKETAQGMVAVNKKDPTDVKPIQLEGQTLMPKAGRETMSSLGRLIAERDALPPNSPLRAQYDAAIANESKSGAAHTSELGKLIAERDALPPNSPFRANYDDAIGKSTGGATPAKTEAAIAGAEDAIGQIDKLLAHPGFSEAVGAGWGTSYIPGSDAKGAIALHNQITGTAFLDAYNSLKGTGSITEIEGQKATAAKARMDLSTSEKDYIEAAKEFQSILKRGIEREKARLKGGAAANAPASNTTSNGIKFTIEP